WRLCKRISHAAGNVDEHTPAEQLHALRIDAKKLRYLIDVVPASGAADDLEDVLRALKTLQRVLGAFNDSHVQQQRLLEYSRARGAGSGWGGGVVAIGRLGGERTQDQDSLRADVVKALDRFRSRGTRAACRRAFRQRDSKEQRP